MQIVVDLKDKASKQLTGINKKFGGMVAAINPVAIAVTAVAASFAAMGGVAVASVNAFRDFEEGMAGVAKTTGMSGEALADLGDGIKEMAKSIPMAHTGLADIAASAGQLGISGKKNILAFTKTVAEVATAFDITAEKAATSMGIMANIYDLPIEKISNLGSAINVMGNTTAASESQVLSFMTNLGAAGVSLGFTSDQAAAMGATLVSMGQEGSDAGTRMKAAFTKMAQNLDKVSGFLGITEEEFKKAFGENPMAMIQQIIGKLNEIEDPLEKDAAAAELFGQVGAKAMNSLAGGADMLTVNLENSAKGFEENTSLSEEFAAKTDTLNASFQLLKNSLMGVAINIGEKLAPHIRTLVEKFIELIPKLEAFASTVADDILPGVIDFAKTLKDDLQPGFDSLKEAAGSMLEVFTGLYEDLIENETAMTTLESVVNVLVDAFNFLAEALAAAWAFFADHPTITKAVGIIAVAIALITTPILAIIAAVALLAVAWDQNWFGIKDTVLRIVDIIVEKVTWFLGIVEDLWSKHGDTITAVVTFVWDLIKYNIETAMDIINTVINVVLDLIEGDWESAWNRIVDFFDRTKDRILELFDKWFGDSITKITDWVTESIQKFSDWKDESIQKILDFVDESIQKFIDWKDESIQKITDFVTESIQSLSDWATDSLQSITDFVTESLQKISDWVTDSIQIITDWATDSLQSISDWATDVLSEIENWASDTYGEIETWATDTYDEIETWASDTYDEIETWASDIYDEISGAVEDAEDSLKAAWGEMKKSTDSIFGGIANTVKTKMDAAKGHVDSAYTKIKDIISKIIKAINAIPDVPDIHNKSAPHDKSSGGHSQSHYDRASCSLKEVSGYDRGAIKFQHGGPVDEDLNADLHEGEYVVPRKGALVLTDSTPSHVKITYNFGNVYGVDDLNRLLEKHDRDLYKKLVALV